MGTTTRRTTAGLVAAALVVLGACGGDDGGDAGRDDYVDALVATMDPESDFPPEEDRPCVAGAMVDAVGVESLSEAVSPDEIAEAGTDFDPQEAGFDIGEAEAQAYYDGLGECMDVRARFVESLSEDMGMSGEDVECLDQALSDEMVRDLFVADTLGGEQSIESDPELTADFTTAITPCVPAGESGEGEGG